jgi:hypothetical protein
MNSEDAMGKPRRKRTRKAKSIGRETTPLDLYALDVQGRPYRPWITVEVDSFTRLIRSIRISAERPN